MTANLKVIDSASLKIISFSNKTIILDIFGTFSIKIICFITVSRMLLKFHLFVVSL